MRSASLRLCDLGKQKIPIGFVGENLYSRIVIDCTEIYREFPHAAASLTVQPPVGDAYPVVVTRDGNNVTWNIQASDVANSGDGEFQLAFTDSPVIARSYIGRFKAFRSLTPDGEAPDPIASWIDDANTAIGTISGAVEDAQAAQAAAEAAQAAAEESADAASESATAASGSATDAADSASAAAGSATSASESAESATGSAAAAAQSAREAAASRRNATGAANDAADFADEAHAWANGGASGTPGATNNAAYYAGQAAGSASTASEKAGNAVSAAESAAESATDAAGSATAAGESATAAAGSATSASGSATAASGSATAASGSAAAAAGSATSADGSAGTAEAYAVGTRGGEAVESTDPAYHNNAKYYAQEAAASAEAAAGIIDDTAGSGDTEKTWSADKLSELNSALSQKQDAPTSGAAADKVMALALVNNELKPVWVNRAAIDDTAGSGDTTDTWSADKLSTLALKTELPVSVITPSSGNTFTLLPCPVTYSFGEMALLTVTVTATSQYHFMFESPSSAATVLTMNGITGTTGDEVEAGKTYEVDVWAGIALIKAVEVTAVT